MLPEALSAGSLFLARERTKKRACPCRALWLFGQDRREGGEHEFLRGVDCVRRRRLTLCRKAQRAFDGRARCEIGGRCRRYHAAAYGRPIARSPAARAMSAPPLDLDLARSGASSSVPTEKDRIDRLSRSALEVHAADRRVHDHGENVAAAEGRWRRARQPLILFACMKEPSQEKLLRNFSDYLKTIGIPFAKRSSPSSQRSSTAFSRVPKGRRNERGDERRSVLRTQAQAIYAPEKCRPFRIEPGALCAFHFAQSVATPDPRGAFGPLIRGPQARRQRSFGFGK